MGYLDEAASIAALRAALDTAVRKRGGPGPDGVTLAQFAASAETELTRLRDELLSGTYHPRPGRRVLLPKPGGGHRGLAIGCVRDRVVQHALAATLSSRLDATLHDFAYAYRRGRSAQQALAAIDQALGAGRLWVLRADIEQFFDRIDPPLLLAALEGATHDPELVSVVGTLLSAGVLVGGEISDPEIGTPQGSPLSPFFANLYLTSFDATVAAAGFTMVRYADDLCINVPSRAEAERALGVVRTTLSRLHLALNPRKVEIRHVGEGFIFLGFQFGVGGRKPGPKAARQLCTQLDALLAKRPHDGSEEIDEMLHGWLGYYGSLAGVELPEAVRARAAELEANRAEAAQLNAGALQMENAAAAAGDAAPAAARPLEKSRWGRAAIQLAEAKGTATEAGVAESVRHELGFDPAGWAELADALARFDGPEAAEILARARRYADADEAAVIAAPSPRPARAPSTTGSDDRTEQPRLDPHPADAQQLVDLFGGAEHVFFRDARTGDRVRRERVEEPPTLVHAREHIAGTFWMGVFPLRANNSARFAALRVVQAAKPRKAPGKGADVAREVGEHAKALVRHLSEAGLSPIISLEPTRGYTVWVLFAEPITGARARALLRSVCERTGPPGASVSRELIPAQDVAKRDKPGTGILWPLGLDPRTSQRAWFCDATLHPVLDQSGFLRDLVAEEGEHIVAALRGKKSDAVDPATSPLHDLARAQEVYRGCNVLRHFVDKAASGKGLTTTERYFVADVLGRLGNEATPALEAVLRHLDDYRPGMANRYLARLYPNPTSCPRIREKLPELTAQVGCDCRFRLVPGAYPTPALHAVGAAEIPGLTERVRDAASRGGIARAAQAAMNEGRKELGARAAALCARLADLRRQARAVERSLTSTEAQLDKIIEEGGDAPIETPAGTLRRVVENGVRRFVLDV